MDLGLQNKKRSTNAELDGLRKRCESNTITPNARTQPVTHAFAPHTASPTRNTKRQRLMLGKSKCRSPAKHWWA